MLKRLIVALFFVSTSWFVTLVSVFMVFVDLLDFYVRVSVCSGVAYEVVVQVSGS